jgi:hypothetical protein
MQRKKIGGDRKDGGQMNELKGLEAATQIFFG